MKSFLRCLAIAGVATYTVSCTDVSIKETKREMVTYPFSDPNPIANPSSVIYPYFRFDGYTTQGEKQEWKAIELENQYVKVTVMPEVGGKIWGAVEKSTGNPFIYDNDVVKFRDIAMRGAWTSGGIEINFGIIGHAPWTATPVDYTIRKNDDGSVSCFVGTLDLLTRAWWSCEIKLEKDKAYFTTQTRWYNPTLISEPYYHWMNAGYVVSEDMEFYFTGDAYIGHEGDVHEWSVDNEGHDLAKYKENNFGSAKSYHIVGDVADYYATYWHNKDFGSVHHASFDDKLGRKIFLWGLSREGMIWENMLTDSAGQYAELQSGRLFNQESAGSASTPYKHFNHAPAVTENFLEYWYPVKDTKGVVATNEYATLNLKDEGDKLSIYLSPLQAINESFVIRSGGREIYRKEINLSPMQSFADAIDKSLVNGPLEVSIGNNLLTYSQQEAQQPLSRPKVIEPTFDQNSLYGKYIMGCQRMNVKDYLTAQWLLIDALKIDPNYAPALNALASIDYRQGRYEQAVQRTLKSLSIDTYDAQANLIYGVASASLGRSKDAIDAFSVAALTAGSRTAAYIGLGKEFAKKQEWNRVAEYAAKILDQTDFNADAYQLMSVAARNNGDKVTAEKALANLEQIMPLNHFIRFERYRMDKGSKEEFLKNITSELSGEIMLEIGIWYESLGAYADAIALYDIMAQNPLANYRKAYIQSALGHDYSAALQAASSAVPNGVFPSRHEFLPVLTWAKTKSDNWKNSYYLGLLKWSLGDKGEALALLESLGNTPDYPQFYLTRAELKSGEERLKDLLKSESMEQSWRIGMMLIAEYKKTDNQAKMIETAEKYYALYRDDFRLGMAYVPVLMANGKYEEAIKYLESVTIIPYEGAFEGRAMYRDSYLYLALATIRKSDYKTAQNYIDKSTLWIENLGVGKPFDEDIDTRTEDYLKAYCYQKQGDKAKADELYTKVADNSEILNSNTVLSALTLRKLGRSAEAQELLKKYQGYHNNPNVAEWTLSIYNGDRARAKQIEDTKDVRSGRGPFGANNFKDYGYFTIVKEVVGLD